jgi:hypothetical protein
MSERRPSRFEIRLPPEMEDRIDEWRRAQPDLPPRAEAARRLIELGLTVPPPSAPAGGSDPGGVSKPSATAKPATSAERKPGRQAEPAQPQGKEAQIRALREQGAN